MNIHQKESIFFTDVNTMLFLFTYPVCDEKVKKSLKIKVRIFSLHFNSMSWNISIREIKLKFSN